MPRIIRAAAGNTVYHVLNRANGRATIFNKQKDYEAFEKILVEAKERYPMRILAYCIMPNHWHFILYPHKGSELSQFMRWITLTHTQRWHTHYKSVGYGHLYQGRFKSFPVQKDEHFLQVVRYAERNALRAKLVRYAQDWRWSSSWRREYGTLNDQKLLSKWPVPKPSNYLDWLNTAQPHEEERLQKIRYFISRSRPYGSEKWTEKTVKKLGLESTLKPHGRPRWQEKVPDPF